MYPDFQASSSYEHLCDELTTGAHSPPRLPPGPPYRAAGEPPLPDAVTITAAAAAASVGSSSSSAVAEVIPLGEQSSEQSSEKVAPVAVTPSRVRGHGGGLNGGSSGLGGGEVKPRSPFSFLGGAGSPSKESRGHLRRSSAPGFGVVGGGVGGGGGGDEAGVSGGAGVGVGGGNVGSGGGSGSGVGRRESWGEAFRSEGNGGGRDTSARSPGPEFEVLWMASRGWLLEKVMRRIELPSYISRHRPPWGMEGQARRRGGGGAGELRRRSRSGSGTALTSGGRGANGTYRIDY